MWICTTTGFMSATLRPAKDIEPGDERTIQVRARRAEHLEHLRQLMAANEAALSETIRLDGRDYQYRAYCTQFDLGVGMAALAMEIDYTNFKNTVVDVKLHNAYMRIWNAMLAAFPEGSLYGLPWPRRGGRKAAAGKRGGRRGGKRGASAGLATIPFDLPEAGWLESPRPWWEGGPSVDEELAMATHDRAERNPFDDLGAAWERP